METFCCVLLKTFGFLAAGWTRSSTEPAVVGILFRYVLGTSDGNLRFARVRLFVDRDLIE